LCVIVLAAVSLRVYLAEGFVPVDEAEFARVAYGMSHGTFDYGRFAGPPVIPVRTGTVLPVAASMALFGPGEVQLAIYPLLTTVVVLLLIYLFAARMFGHPAAIIASSIWVFLPMEITIATTVWPEIPMTAFAFIGIYCIYIARTRDDIGPRAQLLYGLAGGLAFGMSWLAKEAVIYFAPFCLALILVDFRQTRFKRLPLWGGVAAASLAVLVGEMLVYQIINGDLLYRFTAIQKNYELYPDYFFLEGSRLGFGFEAGASFWKAIIKRVALDGPAYMFLNQHSLFLPSFGALAALYGWYRRDSRFYFMAGLLVVLAAMFNGFSTSLKQYQPLPLFPRYFYPVSVPAVILTGGMLSQLIGSIDIRSVWRERSESAFWGGIVTLMLVSIIAWSTFRLIRDDAGKWARAEKYLSRVVSPEDRIHTDPLSKNGLEFFWRYPGKMNVSVYGEPGQHDMVQCGDYVLRNRSYNSWLTSRPGMWLTMKGFETPSAVENPPETWHVQWKNENATLFKVACGG
jgi:4-amino-4-deoxy-L-arabinose transferase-like glycosyltransferase